MSTYFILHQDNNYGLQTIREIRCPGNAGIVSCFSTRVEEKELFQRKHQGCICCPTPSKEHVPRLSHPYTQRERIFLTRELTCLKADIILRGFPNLASSSGVLLDGVWSHALFPPKAKPFWKLVVFYWEEMCTNLCYILVSPRTVNYCKIGYFR